MSPPRLPALIGDGWVGYAAALGSVALVSALIGLIEVRLHVANISMLYLIAVLASASWFGSGPAVLASVLAFLTFNWFFVEPRHTLNVGDAEEWVALLLFLATAVITGQLAAGQRRRAQDATRREREAVVLYDVARLTGDPDLERALQTVAERLRQELSLAVAGIELDDGAGLAARAAAGESEALQLLRYEATTPTRMLAEGLAPSGARRGAPGRWVRVVSPGLPGVTRTGTTDRLRVVPIKAGERRLGKLRLVRSESTPRFSEGDNRLLSAVAAQVGLAAERARLRREATHAEVLRRTDELKTALLNAVSHDLRTPLASIIAAAGSLGQRDVAWAEQERREFAEAIEQEARRLNRIVGNLLDLSRIEAGSLRPERSWYDLGALMDDVLGRLRPATASHRLVVDIPEDLPPVALDYVQIDQVLSNLIENAVKHTPPGTEISVSARCTGAEVQVDVADRGPGLPPDALPALFRPFYRADGQGRRAEGAGVGLAVVRGLVEAHGGRIRAEHREGGGARFVFTLPLAAPDGESGAGRYRT